MVWLILLMIWMAKNARCSACFGNFWCEKWHYFTMYALEWRIWNQFLKLAFFAQKTTFKQYPPKNEYFFQKSLFAHFIPYSKHFWGQRFSKTWVWVRVSEISIVAFKFSSKTLTQTHVFLNLRPQKCSL